MMIIDSMQLQLHIVSVFGTFAGLGNISDKSS
jgi:hypothetical protein